jgi:hypothetical protein
MPVPQPPDDLAERAISAAYAAADAAHGSPNEAADVEPDDVPAPAAAPSPRKWRAPNPRATQWLTAAAAVLIVAVVIAVPAMLNLVGYGSRSMSDSAESQKATSTGSADQNAATSSAGSFSGGASSTEAPKAALAADAPRDISFVGVVYTSAGEVTTDVAGLHEIGFTTTSYDPETGELLDADMELFAWDGVRPPDGFGHYFTCEGPTAPACTGDPRETLQSGCTEVDLSAVVAHEAGHMLGLDHVCSGRFVAPYNRCDTPELQTSVMVPTVGKVAQRALSADDVEGVCTVYPKGASTLTCLPGGAVPPPKSSGGGGGGCSSAGGAGVAGLLAIAVLARRQRRPRR